MNSHPLTVKETTCISNLHKSGGTVCKSQKSL